MKILFCHFGIYKKGGWARTYYLAKNISKHNNKVYLLTSNTFIKVFPIKIQKEGSLTIIIVPYFGFYFLVSKGFGFISLIIKLLVASSIKVKISHADVGHRPLAGIPCKWNRLLYKSYYFSEWWDYYGIGGQFNNKSRFFKILLGAFEIKSEIKDKINADGVIVLSNYMKERAIQYNIERKKILVLHGGANTDLFPYIKNNAEVKDKFSFPNNSIIFGFIGLTESDIDDLEPFLLALKKLNRKEFYFLAVSNGISQVTKEKYNLFMNYREITWQDYFLNPEILSCVDVFILIKKQTASNLAGWPNKFGDYLAIGRPVLLSPYGEIYSFINKYNKGAFFITERDVKLIMSWLNYFYEKKEDIPLWGEKNRKIAENNISWFKISEKLLNFYQKVLSNSKK